MSLPILNMVWSQSGLWKSLMRLINHGMLNFVKKSYEVICVYVCAIQKCRICNKIQDKYKLTIFSIMREPERRKNLKKENEHVALNLHELNVLVACPQIAAALWDCEMGKVWTDIRMSVIPSSLSMSSGGETYRPQFSLLLCAAGP